MSTLRTLAAGHRHEIAKIKGSRFMASVEPVGSAAEAAAFITARREEFRAATHNCWAWRLETEDQYRYSDDGEPSGSAGRPILKEIEGRGLQNVAAVVTRWYGGTKLGTGGLVRAYSAAAGAALDLAQIIERPIVEPLEISFGYHLSGAVDRVLTAFALEPNQSDYQATISMTLAVPIDRVEPLRRELVEATAGQVLFAGDRSSTTKLKD